MELCETIKIFFISIFTCRKMSDVRMSREQKRLIKSFKTQQNINWYHTYSSLDTQSTTSSIFYPNNEVYID